MEYWSGVKLIKGRDGEVCAARLRAGKAYLKRAIQQLCPTELSCDVEEKQQDNTKVLDPEAREFLPKRGAAGAAKERIREILSNEELD
jgi:hypothetical protein